ncbi:MAG: PQQ-binding-like beta-propeller repeat protein [Desulfobacterota bacterium]|nr:PQQ-binding-like beta-propeller repeat protein [Thermodesulfobacteriota bacterium]
MRKKWFLVIVWCMGGLLYPAVGWTYLAQAPWPMLQKDMYHTGQNSSYGLNLQNAQQKFITPLGVSGIAAPIVDTDGTVYIVGADGCLYKVGADGSADCVFDGIDGPVEATPLLSSQGILYIATARGSLHAVSRSGVQLWVHHCDEPLLSSPVVGPGGRIYVGSGTSANKTDGFLYCVAPDGERLWEYHTGAVGHISPVINQYGDVIIASLEGMVYAIDPDGDLLWSSPIPQGCIASPVIGPDDTFYITTPSSLVVLDANGIPKRDPFVPVIDIFDMPTESGFAAAPAVDAQGNVYIGGILGDIYSLDPNGILRWSVMVKEMTITDPMPVPILAAPTLDRQGRLYVRSGNYVASLSNAGKVYGILRFTDNERDQTTAAEASPVLGLRRTLFIPYTDGTLYALCPKRRVLTVSGTVTGDVVDAITIVAKALDQTLESYETRIAQNGTFVVQDLYPGSYIIAPVAQGIRFEPPARTIRLGLVDVGNVNFTAIAAGATIASAQAMPPRVPNNTNSEVLFTAEISHPLGAGHIATVTVDLSPIGGSAEQAMNDSGVSGDTAAGDGIYSCTARVTPSVSIQFTGLRLTVCDTENRVTSAVIPFEVFNEISGTGDDTATYQLLYQPGAQCSSGPCGNTFIIQFQQQNGLGSMVVNPYQSASLEQPLLLLQVFSPSNTGTTPDYEQPILNTLQKIRITNAQTGVWRYRVVNSGQGSAQYTITTTTAGTGILLGTVTDAQTGMPVEQAVVATSVGGSTRTQQGYYMLVSPAGILQVNVADSAHAPASSSVNLMAGGTTEANFLMLPKGSGTAGTCPLETALGSDNPRLERLRRFRDEILPMTGYAEGVQLYYRFATDISNMIKDDAALNTMIAHAVVACIPIIDTMLAGGHWEMTQQQTDIICQLLTRLRTKAPPGLAAYIDRLKHDLMSGDVVKHLRNHNRHLVAQPE